MVDRTATRTIKPRPAALFAVGLAVLAALAAGSVPVGAIAALTDIADPAGDVLDPPRQRDLDADPGTGATLSPALLEDAGEPVVITGRGWGHSVGMSQYGAQAQALSGYDHGDILSHWYPGTNVAGHRRTTHAIAVNLFHNRSDVETDRVQLQTAGGDGVSPMTVELGSGETHAIPRPQVWTVRHTDGEFALADEDGTTVDRGPGPVRVELGTGERPNRLRMPQLTGGDALAGQYRWGTLRITVGEDGALHPVLVLPIELYLRGLAEMPSGWHPEALAAQAVAGRGYAVRMVGDGLRPECDCHLGTTPHDQAYTGWQKEGGQFGDRWRGAVAATEGRVLAYRGQLAWTYYSSSHAGRTENSGDSWAYPETLPYLTSVEDRWSADPRVSNPMRTWERTLDNAEVARVFALARVDEISIVDRTEGGTPRTLAVRGVDWFGNAVDTEFRGWRKGVAGADLKLALRSTLPSMQIDSITVGD